MDEDAGGGAGGIWELARIVGEHLQEAVQDFRSIYGVSLWAVPTPEVWHLVRGLIGNTTSRLNAAFAGWSSPFTREQAILMDIYDLQVRARFQPPHTPYPRPWDRKPITRLVKKRTATEALAILRPNRRTDG